MVDGANIGKCLTLGLMAGLLIANSAMIETPPSPEKTKLIAEFLCLSETQRKIDNGQAVEAMAIQDGFEALKANSDAGGRVLGPLTGGPLTIVSDAYQSAYLRHKAEFQSEFERHVNWEFSESELRTINAFLGSAAGKHYLAGNWRMNAYVVTNTEDLVLKIAAEAKSTAKAALAAKGFRSAPVLDMTYQQMTQESGMPHGK